MVPALFLRSKEGMAAAATSQSLEAFLCLAKDRLREVIECVVGRELARHAIELEAPVLQVISQL